MDSIKYLFLCLLICFCQSCFSVNGYVKDDIVKLKTDLFTNYDASVRPIIQQSEAMQVQVKLSLSTIVNIDTDNAVFDAVGYILANWQDEFLTWDPAHYANLTNLKVDIGEIWNPEITQLDMVGEFASTTFAFIEFTGMVTMVTNSELRSFCELDMRYYPRDSHVCTVVLFSACYPSSELSLVPLTDTVMQANYKGHGTWLFQGSSVYTEILQLANANGSLVDLNQIVYTIEVIRRVDHSFFHKFAILVLIMFINALCHFIPLNSGDRITFSVTAFLALVFWEAVISDDVPHKALSNNLVAIFMYIPLYSGVISVLTSVGLNRISSWKNVPIPSCLKRFVAFVSCHNRKTRATPGSKLSDRYTPGSSVDMEGTGGGLHEESQTEAENKPSTENEDGNKTTWKDVTNTLDFCVGFCMLICFVANACILIVVCY